MGRDLERQLTTEDGQMAKKHVRRHSKPFVRMELQIRTRRCHHTQIKKGKKNQNKTKTSQNCQHQMLAEQQGLLGTVGPRRVA